MSILLIVYTHHLSSFSTLGLCDLLNRPLDFLDIDGLAADLDGGLEEELDLLELVGIAGDKVDVVGHLDLLSTFLEEKKKFKKKFAKVQSGE